MNQKTAAITDDTNSAEGLIYHPSYRGQAGIQAARHEIEALVTGLSPVST